MPLVHLALLALVVAMLIGLIGWPRWHSFFAILAASALFGLATGQSISLIGKAFGTGFANTFESAGLVIIAGAVVLAVAKDTGAGARLSTIAAAWRRRWPSSAPSLALLGLVGGLAATPIAAFAILTPLRRCLEGSSRRWNAGAAVALALAITAGHGLLPPAPGPMAAAAILGADPARLALVGLPAAITAVLAGGIFLRACYSLLPDGEEAPVPAAAVDESPRWEIRRGTLALIVATSAMLVLLIVQSLGEIASEPFGIGPTRELLLGVGRPGVLLFVGIGLALLLTGRWGAATLSERGLAGRAVAGVAGIILTIGAAGGLQALTQETGMAALLAEPLLDWRAGLLVPFAVAAVVKTAQGSSLVAAITAAGMVQPALVALGLDGATGRALAAAAVGLGAMTASHVNDPFFWLAANAARLPPGRGLLLISLGTIVQGLTGLAVLAAIGTLLP
jgi:GntP family gluconate:H+ symporter